MSDSEKVQYPSQPPKVVVNKLLELVEENKEKMKENDYLDMCIFLKTVYNLGEEESSSDSDDEDDIVMYRVSINKYLRDLGADEILNIPLYEGICIDENIECIHNYYDVINQFILTETIDKYDLDTVKKLVEQLGGEQECLKLFKHYNNNPLFRKKVMKKQFDLDVEYYRCLAFYGIHKRTFDWEQVEHINCCDAPIYINELMMYRTHPSQ